MIDIDKFKNVNDLYGHDVGDKVICDVVNTLNAQLRASDLMSRFGGEEFCIIIDNISLEDTHTLFENIRAKMDDQKLNIDGKIIEHTISIGIYHGAVANLDDMIKTADKALYYCKENGRNQIKIQ